MKPGGTALKTRLAVNIEAAAGLIARTQKDNGEIPWFIGDKTDPWDHVESAMGLSIGGYLTEASRAYAWMRRRQLPDGSWYAAYRDGCPEDRTRDTNMSAYIAVGAFHYYLITGDKGFLRQMWETVEAAIDFAVDMQAPGGEIHWAKSPEGRIDPMGLLTGSCSIFMSLKCALAVAAVLGQQRPDWQEAMAALGNAICHKPQHFNQTKARFSMDWFYPILCGAIGGEDAQRRIDAQWRKFVVPGHGVRCVSDQPWITMAETSELCLALSAMGNTQLSRTVFNWIVDKAFDDGSYWCGHTFPDMTVWPEDKITWTNAVVIMAADALYHLTPACGIFSHRCWQAPQQGRAIFSDIKTAPEHAKG
ncbi:MAG: phenyltransferase domain-containing protein [Desulfobacterales bacterium]|nr:phenyltransferase domain-containing protein [Desulfobacterales bacterium]